MAYSFEVKNVVKHFGDVKALNGISLKSEEGTVFGLLGPNGAGKTTLVRILSTLLQPDHGSVKVHGIDALREPERVRETIGLAGQYAAVDEFLTGYENVYMVGRLYRLSHKESARRTKELLEQLHLSSAAHRPVRTYSGGMRRRLDLGASLVGRPKILFLDEPTTGLDPKTRIDLWNIIRDLVKEGTSILLTTQYLDEADQLADKIAVVNEGKVIAEGTSSELKAQLGGDIVEFGLTKAKDKDKALSAVTKLAKQPPTFDENTLVVRVPVANGAKHLMDIVQALNNAKLTVATLSLHQPSLDDVFLALTGEKAKDTTVNKRDTKKGGQQ
ncbi:MAG TPA: ATP-binding cassette domain-containing protein [Candidatus Saccharimonadales bacterium]|nr:ATP-binding cassette domain-containing protein [Candidatus Saccharimonadales bacterium]